MKLFFVVAALHCLLVSALRAHAVFKNRFAVSVKLSASAHEAMSMAIVTVPSTVPQRPSLSVSGQEMTKRFVEGDKINKDLEYPSVAWFREPEMDDNAAELLKLHEGSLELDTFGVTVQVGQKSSNGLVEHVGEGVYVENNTMSIDPDSETSLRTITRRDLRVTARLAINTVDDPKNKRKVTCVGQAGTGKTRGGLAYTLQELLWRGDAVMRVGYKNEKAFLFLPDEHGVYKVWRTDSSVWSLSELAKDKRSYALIDPPESGEYIDSADCRIIKWASNNAEKHYQNWQKDGHILFSAMPFLSEVLAMIPTLWNDEKTPFSSQHIDTAEAKQGEIKNRFRLVGGVLRALFNHRLYRDQVDDIVTESVTLALMISPVMLMSYYEGTVSGKKGDASSVSSKSYFIGPQPNDPSRCLVKVSPLALYTMEKQLEATVANFDFKAAFEFETFVNTILCKGVKIGNFELPKRKRVNASIEAMTSELIRDLTGEEMQLVVASTKYPVLDSAASRYDWYNATIKSTASVDSGAFVSVMTLLGLASVVQDELGRNVLQWKGKEGKKVTLTFVRNNPSDKCNFKKSKSDYMVEMDFDMKKLRAFYKKHVVVKSLNASDWEKYGMDIIDTNHFYTEFLGLVDSNVVR